MPEATLAPEEELVQEEEVIQDEPVAEEEEEEKETKPRTRMTLSDDNVYVFPVGDKPLSEVKDHAKSKLSTLRYNQVQEQYTDANGAIVMDGDKPALKDKFSEDELKVTGFRVHVLTRTHEDTGDVENVACVLGRTSQQASEFYLDSKGFNFELGFKKGGRGRTPTKIVHVNLQYGKLIEPLIKAGNAPDNIKEDWALYCPGGPYAHYRNDDGSWKKANA